MTTERTPTTAAFSVNAAKFALHRYATTTEAARDINRIVDGLVAAIRAEPRAELDEAERACTEVMTERDEAQDWADRLASALAPDDVIGEHSNLNNPWQNALDYAEPRAEGLRAALEREPTLDEVLEYGLDGAANPDGYLFNTLQWRLDLVRHTLATNGICRGCGHRWYSHGYIGPVHTCAGCREAGRPECERYVRDRRIAKLP